MAAEGEGNTAPWSLSTNWVVSDGSLDGSISFDTSSSPAAGDDPDAMIPVGVLLTRPPSADPPPCEITIHFRSKHEIHRIYMRSTARVYEVYYALNYPDNSNEYLCTVRCGQVASPSDDEDYGTQHQQVNNGTAESCEQTGKNGNTSGEEDGWVEVKIPESPQQEVNTSSLAKMLDRNTNRNMEVHYEATAEISDASPCVSITLRLLSLKNKEHVHVEEIYIYADPVEPTNSDHCGSGTGNMEGSSLMSMLVPSLLQLSQSRRSRIQGGYFSQDFMAQKQQYAAGKAAESSLVTGRDISPEINLGTADPKSGLDGVEQRATEETDNTTDIASDERTNYVLEKNHVAHDRVEKVLDELVMRVGKIEAFCSRFEENMMKPLSCIEMRLQRMEQQLDAFAMKIQSSEAHSCSKFSSPIFSFDESDSYHKNCETSKPEGEDDSTHDEPSPSDGGDCQISPLFKENGSSLDESSSDDVLVTMSSSQMSPLNAVKAPDLLDEDDRQMPAYSNSAVDTSDSVTKHHPQGKKFFTIESILASALEGFLSSSTGKSTSPSPSEMDNNCKLSFVPSATHGVLSEGSGDISDDTCLEKRASNSSDLVRKETADDTSPVTEDTKTSDFGFQNCPGSVTEDTKASDFGFQNCPGSVTEDTKTSDFGFQNCPGLVISAPEFHTEEDDSAISNDTSNPWLKEPSFVQDPSQGAKNLGVENQENDLSCNAFISQADNFVPHAVTTEPNDNEGYQEQNFTDAPAQRSDLDDFLPEVKSGHNKHISNLPKCSSTGEFEGVFTRDILHSPINNPLNREWADESDVEESPFEGLRFNQLGRGWTTDSCLDLSSDETSIDNKVHIEWSDESSVDSLDRHYGHFSDDFGSTRATVASMDTRSVLSEPSTVYDHEIPKTEVDWTVNSRGNDGHPDVKFSPARDWTGETPLEVLLGESSQTGGQTLKHDGFNEGMDLHAKRMDQLLVELEDPPLSTTMSNPGVDMLDGHYGTGTHQLFSSLI